MKTGKFMRNVCTGMLAGGLMLPLSVEAVNEPINIQVTISNPQPGCNVTVLGGSGGGNTQKLSGLNRLGNEQPHSPFTIQVSCNGDVRTRMKASTITGAVQGDGKSLAVVMNNDTSMNVNNRPLLKLKVDNQFVNLQNGEWFCNASNQGKTQECRITPVTLSNSATRAGTGKAAVSFTIDYFL